jgi:hypothetical protein
VQYDGIKNAAAITGLFIKDQRAPVIFAISGMILTAVIDHYERRFDKWRPKVGAE